MEVGVISMRYAKALLEYATENKAEERVYREMLTLSKTFFEVPELRRALDNPVLDLGKKISLICTAAGEEVSMEYTRFMRLVFKERRERYLQSISLMYIDLYRRVKNITVGKLITAYPVDKTTEDRMKAIVRHVTHGIVEFQVQIDPRIEGGFIYEVASYRVDASVASQFRRVKKQFIDKNRRIV